METNRILRVCGSVIKKESVVLLTENTLKDTCVAEADSPYANYYGNVPEIPKPNSLFLFTVPFYLLEEVLRFSQMIDECVLNKVDVATAVLDFQSGQYPAIRIKNFRDYEHLPMLQECFKKQGVQFSKKVQIGKEAVIRIHKCFTLEEVEAGIYLDKVEKNKGYVEIPGLLSREEFIKMMTDFRNNSDCCLFDAAKCGIILNAEVKELIRVFSEKLEINLLRTIKKEIKKRIPS